MMPPPPTRFSTTICWPSASDSRAATRRPVTSMLPPAAKGTRSLIGRSGQSGRVAVPAKTKEAKEGEGDAEEAPALRMRAIFSWPHHMAAWPIRNKVGSANGLICVRPMTARPDADRKSLVKTARLRRGRRTSDTSPAIASRHFHACVSVLSTCGPSSGRRTTTVVPAPSVERMRITPPCSSISDLAMARPSPEPCWVLVSWLSTCSNGRPSFCSASRGNADAGILDADHHGAAGDPGRAQ